MNEFRSLPFRSLADDTMPGRLIGTAPAFASVVAQIPVLARSDAAVLISGETGTGKELVSRAIHALGPRASRPFVAVNCGSFVDTLLEDELFGHERGAFTDAHARQEGLIAHAAQGTVLLDEVDTLTPRAQVTLLRVLQDGTFRRLGSAFEHRADVRFLASTNTALKPLVDAGSFRADLYYRLSVFSLTLPPLRERPEDILPLAEHFLRKHSAGAVRARLSAVAEEALLALDWPGNIRELESTIVRALTLAHGGLIETSHLGLPGGLADGSTPSIREAPNSYKAQKRRVLEAFERQYLVRLMAEHQGNVSRAARAAGKERRDLGKLLKRHGLEPRRFASG